eukprot:gene44-182_t
MLVPVLFDRGLEDVALLLTEHPQHMKAALVALTHQQQLDLQDSSLPVTAEVLKTLQAAAGFSTTAVSSIQLPDAYRQMLLASVGPLLQPSDLLRQLA